jgi:hypothetical protein
MKSGCNAKPLKGVAMKLKTVLFSILILTAFFVSAFGSPAAPVAGGLQDTPAPTVITTVVTTVEPPGVTVVAPTTVAGTPAIPVTGVDPTSNLWTLILFGLLGLLAIAFLVALFTPRTTHEHIDRNPPPPPDL